jgi:hypothetical protein
LAKIILFLYITLGIFSASFAQKIHVNVHMPDKTNRENGDTIYHDANKKLTWSDFKGIPDNNHFGGAVTASGFAYDAEMNMIDNEINLDIWVYTFFNKKFSWKKPSINSDYHLLHEQHHFDITRISAEKFCHQLAKANFTINNYKKLLPSIFDGIFDEHAAMQKDYDTQTQHSINTKEQLRWNDKIAAEIKKL